MERPSDQLFCPSCGTRVPVRLAPGLSCADCESKSAWDRHSAGTTLVVTRDDVVRAETKLKGELAGVSLARRALPAIPCTIAAVFAIAGGFELAQVLRSQPIGPLAELKSTISSASLLALGAGCVAFVSGLWALLRLRKSRLYRAWWLTAAGALGLVGGLADAAAGGTFAFLANRGVGWKFDAVPSLSNYLAKPASGSPFAPSIMKSTAVIVAPGADGDAKAAALGSGSVIRRDDEHAWIVTCSHVAMPYASTASFRDASAAQPVWVYLADGRDMRGRVVWTAQPPLDVAVVQVDVKDPPPAIDVSERAEDVHEGDGVLLIPNPMREGWKVLSGAVSRREPHDTPAGRFSLIFVDLHVQPGDSGSGLFDAQGRLVGITTWGRFGDGASPAGICLPSETMQGILERFAQIGSAALPGGTDR